MSRPLLGASVLSCVTVVVIGGVVVDAVNVRVVDVVDMVVVLVVLEVVNVDVVVDVAATSMTMRSVTTTSAPLYTSV